ncbi:MAG: hypothetical protein AM1032_000367 [Mycoplasmataceae bacterium]|nr:MAG: hypothetical protein AM1032_000367 [Mycoplasmataceae bacterium]
MNNEKEMCADEWLKKWYPINGKSSDLRNNHPGCINFLKLTTNYWKIRIEITSLDLSYSDEGNIKAIYPESVKLLGDLNLTTFLNLKHLNVNGNLLTNLELPTSLENLCCNNSSLNFLNVKLCYQLKFLSCIGNQINDLDLRNNLNLRCLCCCNNQLKRLDLRQNNVLIILDCAFNQIEEILLDSIESLEVIKLNDNLLTSFPYEIINIEILIELSLFSNNLERTNIDIFKNFKKLEKLLIGNLDFSKIEKGIYNYFCGSLESLKNLTNLELLMADNTHITNCSENAYLRRKNIINYSKPSYLLKKVFDIKLRSLSLEEEKIKYNNLLVIEE